MELLSFTKAHGSGNDFILVDDRQLQFPIGEDSWISRLCDRRFGIGADGLILLQHSTEADYRMRYFNADGKEARLCGNGVRCFVAFAHELGDARPFLSVETASGIIACRRDNERISIGLPSPELIKGPFSLALSSGVRDIFHVQAGVPHAILFSENLEKEDVFSVGKEIRYHPALGPLGANVNFIAWHGKNEVRVRTYERGVEEETWACGTGALAVAKVISLLKLLERVVIIPRSQECMEINTTTWELTGPAQLVYKGIIRLADAMVLPGI